MIEGEKGIITEQFEENSRWSLVNTTVEEVKGVDAMVIFKMKLKRKSTFYVFNILIPMVLLSFLNVLTFVLPVSSGERASYAVTVFLSLAVFLTIVASEIPKNSNTISIVSVYMTAVLALRFATVMTSLLELRLASRAKDKDLISSGYMNSGMSNFLYATQGCPLCLLVQQVTQFISKSVYDYINLMAAQMFVLSDMTSIIDFNEREESITISGYLGMEWIDEFLKWEPEDYG
ncbi:acetylcholine receptor subunit delta-like [Dreissena polymorpha]|uniref:acetylcholine receptor subunit delta-like n=1 Tax=Dreissena polymorpha TaxID=45954 RepID=UPI002263EDBD|nr:acetylcholine receptor subunit delta-like [Dreissena polymorpha]